MTINDVLRAENCTMLLSKLKMSNEKIARVNLDIDSQHILSLDMVELLLNFNPCPDEAPLFEEHSKCYYLVSLATADRFLHKTIKFLLKNIYYIYIRGLVKLQTRISYKIKKYIGLLNKTFKNTLMLGTNIIINTYNVDYFHFQIVLYTPCISL